MVQTNEDDGYAINLHYFPPCSTVKLPEEWKVFATVFSCPTEYLTGKRSLFKRSKPKYPDIYKQLHEIDETLYE